ncbi:hypothetical protein SAMN05192553_103121 [Cyclobacterium xiamenense]|uniref:DoxX-like family protein n=1 Tax=Cyclobacterium xiamenense TaxID=1297121 RepID=A0A1H6XZR3_9BACT|nr:hypothetical protein [Cyclobacterium xiamenense]SEJ30035.1 hypothetical protein SAMN05192553_103121 [Cyclobacterium xiamenense]
MKNPSNPTEFPRFTMPHRGLLLLAGIYTILWGAFFRWFGPTVLNWLAMDAGLEGWSGTLFYGSLGMIAGLLVFLSAFYPISWVYLMGLGIVMKVASLVSFLILYMGDMAWNKRLGFHLIFNETLWLIPLTIILWKALQVKKYLKSLSDQ